MLFEVERVDRLSHDDQSLMGCDRCADIGV